METPIEPDVGSRIRALRERQSLSLRALAKRCSLSVNAISRIERGESSPTLTSLHQLALALEVPITDFFEDESNQVIVFIKRHQRPQSSSEGIVMENLGSGLPNQQIEPFLVTVEPGTGSAATPITHAGEEFVHCLEGEVEYKVGDQIYTLQPGDSLLFEASQPHCFCNTTGSIARVMLIFQASHNRHLIWQSHLDMESG
jgi:transcriptional regulator with XRE-family HTH domain